MYLDGNPTIVMPYAHLPMAYVLGIIKTLTVRTLAILTDRAKAPVATPIRAHPAGPGLIRVVTTSNNE